MKKRRLAVLAICAAVMTGCQKQEAPELTDSEKQQLAQSIVDEIDASVEDMLEGLDVDSLVGDITGNMDLDGMWMDEASQRASMEITENDDESCDIVISWGNSASETAVWKIHGTYDPIAGMLAYEDGEYTVHTTDSEGKETVSPQESTSGVLLKEGEKIRWQDSQNATDALFARVE